MDDTHVVINGVDDADGFEGTSSWAIGGPPPGSAPNAGNWEIGGQAVELYGGVSTEDTLLLGFGLEQLATRQDDRARLLAQALGGLLGDDN